MRTDYWNPKVMRAYDSSLKEDETHPCNMEEIMMVTDLECDCHRDIRDSYQTYHERSTYIKDIWIESFDTIQFTRKSQNKGEGLRSILLGREKEVKEEIERAKRIEEEQTTTKEASAKRNHLIKLLRYISGLSGLIVIAIILYTAFGPNKNVSRTEYFVEKTLRLFYVVSGVGALFYGLSNLESLLAPVAGIVEAIYLWGFSAKAYYYIFGVMKGYFTHFVYGFFKTGILIAIVLVLCLVGYIIFRKIKTSQQS